MYEIINADVLDWAAKYDGPKFHAMLCDPPYHLTDVHTGGKAIPGKFGQHTDEQKRECSEASANGGFMGKKWDGGDISFQPETWAALAEHLHDGAFGMVFAGSRTWHRVACAIEDAGLLIHPSVFCWLNGQGFPKATRIDTQIDKAAGAEREVVGKWKPTGTARPNKGSKGHSAKKTTAADSTYNPDDSAIIDLTAPATPLAAAWEGHRYGLQALKPAVEPIIVFQKPYEDKPVECIVRTGAGALNIDGGRIRTKDKLQTFNGSFSFSGCGGANERGKTIIFRDAGKGRWPANFALVHNPGCRHVGMQRVKGEKHSGKPGTGKKSMFGMEMTGETDCYADGLETVDAWECVEDCPVRRLGEQGGERPTGGGRVRKATNETAEHPCGWKSGPRTEANWVASTGTAARFYYQADWQYEIAEHIDDADPVFYCAKASRKERDAGCDELPLQKRATQGRDVVRTIDRKDGKGTVPVNAQIRPARNNHPTIKPLKLLRWLATLLLPPDIYAPRRIVVPFCGVSSEIIGAGLAGWDEITGIEQEEEYVNIGRARAAYWLERDIQLELKLETEGA